MSFWGTITGTTPQEEQDKQLAEKKAAFDAAIERRHQAGTITPEREAELRSYEASLQLEDTDAAAWEGFKEGLGEGRDNIDRTLFGGLGLILKNIPTVIWVGLAVYLFLTLGGLKTLKGAFKK